MTLHLIAIWSSPAGRVAGWGMSIHDADHPYCYASRAWYAPLRGACIQGVCFQPGIRNTAYADEH